MTNLQKIFHGKDDAMEGYVSGFGPREHQPPISPGREAGRKLAEELKKELEKIMKNATRRNNKGKQKSCR